MYTDSPEEHLQSRGLLYPIKLPSKQIQSIGEEKHVEPVSPKTEHNSKIEDMKTVADIEERKWIR